MCIVYHCSSEGRYGPLPCPKLGDGTLPNFCVDRPESRNFPVHCRDWKDDGTHRRAVLAKAEYQGMYSEIFKKKQMKYGLLPVNACSSIGIDSHEWVALPK